MELGVNAQCVRDQIGAGGTAKIIKISSPSPWLQGISTRNWEKHVVIKDIKQNACIYFV
jgi:hypothetical protein